MFCDEKRATTCGERISRGLLPMNILGSIVTSNISVRHAWNELYIKEDRVYERHEGILVGFVDLGSVNNHLLAFEHSLDADINESTTLAKNIWPSWWEDSSLQWRLRQPDFGQSTFNKVMNINIEELIGAIGQPNLTHPTCRSGAGGLQQFRLCNLCTVCAHTTVSCTCYQSIPKPQMQPLLMNN